MTAVQAGQTHDRPIALAVRSPPSLNALWITTTRGRQRSPAYNKWLEAVGWEIRGQIAGMPPVACRYNLAIEVPISRRDTGNFEKAIGDAMEKFGVVTNDGNCHQLTVTPAVRADCLIVLTPLPAMGDVRKPAPLRLPSRPTGGKMRPTQAMIRRFERGRQRRLLP